MIRKGWLETALDKLLLCLESGKRPEGGVSSIKEGVPSIGGEHLDNGGGFRFGKIKYVPSEFAKNMSKGIVESEDILIVKDGATTGKCSFVEQDFPFDFAVLNEHVFKCRVFPGLHSKFYFYFLFSPLGRKRIRKNFKGSAQGGINKSFAANTIVPLVPLPEQRAIVAKLERMLSEIDDSIAHLKAAQEKLEIYRQSVLKKAFDGKFLSSEQLKRCKKEADYEPAGNLLKKICPKATSSKSAVRGDWVDTRLEMACEIHNHRRNPVNTKERNKRIKGKDETELYPYYGATGQVGFIDGYLTDGEYVLVGEDGAPFYDFSRNTAYMIDGKAWVNNHAHVLRSCFSNKFLMHYLNQFDFHGYVSGTTRLKLTQKSLRRISIKIAPLPEQRAIVSAIESRFAVCDKLSQSIDEALEKSQAMRQSILKKAFDGKLLSKSELRECRKQPDWEPAEKLLERIKASKPAKRKQ